LADIAVEKINKSFGGLKVLADFSHRFIEGSVTCIMGPSGSGKTTLLHIIMGLIRPDSGRVLGIGGDSRLGAVFQEDRLCENLSAVLNVRLVAGRDAEDAVPYNQLRDAEDAVPYNQLRDVEDAVPYKKYGGASAIATARMEAEYLLSRTGLGTEALRKPVRELSGGMRRRVAIARALITKPDILFLDEPFSGLDDVAKADVAKLITECSKGKTIIMVSHSVEDAALLGGDILNSCKL
jgi:ABC-type multidrug transport system ATPase subunit